MIEPVTVPSIIIIEGFSLFLLSALPKLLTETSSVTSKLLFKNKALPDPSLSCESFLSFNLFSSLKLTALFSEISFLTGSSLKGLLEILFLDRYSQQELSF